MFFAVRRHADLAVLLKNECVIFRRDSRPVVRYGQPDRILGAVHAYEVAYTDFSRHVYLKDPNAEQGSNAAEETIIQ